MTVILNFLIALFEAAPALEKLYQDITIGYLQYKKGKNDAAFDAALKKAFEDKDVTDLAQSLGDKFK